jgi:DMSO/TMAO reductase YedYZ molybdopterin-dependent catalytic subunit
VGPGHVLVPHLYFWKGAKWLRGITLLDRDEPEFWESDGYYIYEGPWHESRCSGD